MRMNLGRWDVVYARKNGMKNKVCGPERYLCENESGSMGYGIWHELKELV